MSFGTFDKSRPSSEWIGEYMTHSENVCSGVGWLDWLVLVSVSPQQNGDYEGYED